MARFGTRARVVFGASVVLVGACGEVTDADLATSQQRGTQAQVTTTVVQVDSTPEVDSTPQVAPARELVLVTRPSFGADPSRVTPGDAVRSCFELTCLACIAMGHQRLWRQLGCCVSQNGLRFKVMGSSMWAVRSTRLPMLGWTR